jgi:hypothetical protein
MGLIMGLMLTALVLYGAYCLVVICNRRRVVGSGTLILRLFTEARPDSPLL